MNTTSRERTTDAVPAYGHKPTVFAAFLHFDLSFMIWVLLGALGVSISETLGLSAAQKGLMVAIPILSGSLLRIPLGLLSDRFGGRRVGLGMLLALFIPLFVGWRSGTSLDVLFAIGLMLGVAGASFAVVLPLASRWYPPERQGLVMGIAAAGNSGTVIANLVAPRVAAVVGWQNVLGLTMIPLSLVLAVFWFLAKDSPARVAVLPLASRWYPPERQGLVMGIAAAGNSGTVIANLVAPRVAALVGWQNVLGLTMLPLALVLVAFWFLAKDSPTRVAHQSLASYLTALRERELWWLCLFYSVTFGGYVGLSSFMPLLLRDQYQLPAVTAGFLTALAALAGSGLRPVGGWVADRVGGVRLLSVLLAGIAVSYLAASRLPTLTPMIVILVAAMVCLGLGNGAVFQLVPQCFRRQIGVATGVVGAIGGLGGFMLPTMLGQFKQHTGSFGAGFVVLGGVALIALGILRWLMARSESWRTSWRRAPMRELAARERVAA